MTTDIRTSAKPRFLASYDYTVDVYRREIKAETSWYRFAFFVSFFPHLIAGPIVRATQFLPQLDLTPRYTPEQIEDAIYLIFRGLVKKILFADYLGSFADQLFDAPARATPLETLIGVYAFTFQIYFDFSGYTDIARGSARLLGIELPENFASPYAALSISDFWRRWHISLSNWLRDYLYVALGGNRMQSVYGVCRNLMLTMTLAGLWHGAAWNYVIWGALHGALLSLERVFGVQAAMTRLAAASLPARALLHVFMFHVFVMMWIPFRAESMGQVAQVAANLARLRPADAGALSAGAATVLLISAVALALQLAPAQSRAGGRWQDLPPWSKATAYGVVFALVVVFNSAIPQPFIYFRF